MNLPFIVECAVHFHRRGCGCQRDIKLGPAPVRPVRPPGRVPRIAGSMALALRFQTYLRTGEVRTYRELAQLGQVSRPRISQLGWFLRLRRVRAPRRYPRACETNR